MYVPYKVEEASFFSVVYLATKL